MITSKQRSTLRKLVQNIEPAVYIGGNGLSENVVAEIENYIEAHELIKIKVQESCMENIRELADEAALAVGADVVQVIGRKFSLYRRSKKALIEI